jgi:hypothetical protein
VHQIERPRLRGRISGDVVLAHLVPVACLQPRRVDVRGQHVPGRTDGRRERLRDTGATGPHFPAARASPDPQSIEVPARHTIEQLSQPNESLARLGARVIQQVPAGGSGLSIERGSPAYRIRLATDVRRAGRGGHHCMVNLPRPPAPRRRERNISHSQHHHDRDTDQAMSSERGNHCQRQSADPALGQ